jgi:hypothetical protein
LKSAGWAKEKLDARNKIAETMLGRNRIERETWSVIENFEADAV